MCTYAHSLRELHAWNWFKKEMGQQQTLQGTYVTAYIIYNDFILVLCDNRIFVIIEFKHYRDNKIFIIMLS